MCISLLFLQNLSFQKQTEAILVAKKALQIEAKVSLS